MPAKPNKYIEAIKESGNVIGFSTAVALSAATLNPLPLLAGLVAEAAYLLFVPDSKWFERRLSHRWDAEVTRRRELLKQQTLPGLDAATQNRFARLEMIRQQIDSQSADEKTWFLEVLRKLDYLLEKFLVFASKEAEYRRYLASLWQDECVHPAEIADTRLQTRRARQDDPPPAPLAIPIVVPAARAQQMGTEIQQSYEKEIAELTQECQSEQDEHNKAVLEKRMQVLRQRTEGVGKISRILVNLQNQLALLEDTFGLINDQVRARSPEQILSDIESVVDQSDSMTQLLEDLSPYNEVHI